MKKAISVLDEKKQYYEKKDIEINEVKNRVDKDKDWKDEAESFDIDKLFDEQDKES